MTDRKALVRQYKETRRPMGVFRIRNTQSGKSFLAASADIPSTLNSQRFQLEAGMHPNTALQRDWKELGAAAFEFETLDTLTPTDGSDYDPTADLRGLEELWLEKLAPYGERGYHMRPWG